MPTLNYFLNVIGRCSTLFRARRLEGTGIGPHDHPYLFYVCRHPGTPQDTLCRELYVNKSSVTRHIAHLEREGLVTRCVSPDDRRCLLVYPTEKANQALPLLRQVGTAWREGITRGFNAQEIALFESLLQRAMENARQLAVEEVEK